MTQPLDFAGRPLRAGQVVLKPHPLTMTSAELERRVVHSVCSEWAYLFDKNGKKGGRVTPERLYIVEGAASE